MHTALLVTYLLAGVGEVLGLILTVKRFALRRDVDGAYYVEDGPQERWRLAAGPVLLGVGLVLGVAGNVASVYVS